MAVDIIENLNAETAKQHPDEDLIAADMVMLGRVLVVIRDGVETGHAEVTVIDD